MSLPSSESYPELFDCRSIHMSPKCGRKAVGSPAPARSIPSLSRPASGIPTSRIPARDTFAAPKVALAPQVVEAQTPDLLQRINAIRSENLDDAVDALAGLAYDINDFFQCNQLEQELRLSGKVPTIEEYWQFRYGVSAVAIYCDMHQYITGVKLPAELAWCEEVKTMRMETSAQPCM